MAGKRELYKFGKNLILMYSSDEIMVLVLTTWQFC